MCEVNTVFFDRVHNLQAPAIVGHGVDIDGYGESHLNSHSKIPGASFYGIDGVISQFPGLIKKHKRHFTDVLKRSNR